MKQSIVVLDLEGVLVPEIWIAVAQKTKIPALRRTTRDEPDYDKLMRSRLEILDAHGLKLTDIQKVIAKMRPLPGAVKFLRQLRELTQVIILSDTFAEFAQPLMRQLGWPTIFCHQLAVEFSRIVDYRLRQKDPKRKSVKALHDLNYFVIAAGDSFNDVAMLQEADRGFFFHAPESIRQQYPQFKGLNAYPQLLREIKSALTG